MIRDPVGWLQLGLWLRIRVLSWGFGSEIWVLTWGVYSESGFDSESSWVALIGAFAPNKGVDLGFWLRNLDVDLRQTLQIWI